MKTFSLLFVLVFSLTSLKAFATDPIKKMECDISLQLVNGFHQDPNMERHFNEVFGGRNTVVVDAKTTTGHVGYIVNKNGAYDLDILIVYNYMKQQLEIVGASLVGTVTGNIVNCEE